MPASVKHLSELMADGQKAAKVSLFAKWPSDRLFYPVTLTKLDHTNRKASIRFEDDTPFESSLSEIHLQLNDDDVYDGPEDVICCVCDGGESGKQNEIVICEVCQQGYHQRCHSPKVPNNILQSEDDWTCSTCQYMMVQLKQHVPGGYSSTPAARKDKKPIPKVGKQQMKVTKEPRVKLPVGSKAKAEADVLEPPRRLGLEVSPIVPSDCSSEHSLAATLEKLTTETDATLDSAPMQAVELARNCLDRGKLEEKVPKTQTPDLVEAMASNKALELHEDEPQPPIMPSKGHSEAAHDKGPAALADHVPAIKAKPAAKKATAKKPATAKAPRKYIAARPA